MKSKSENISASPPDFRKFLTLPFEVAKQFESRVYDNVLEWCYCMITICMSLEITAYILLTAYFILVYIIFTKISKLLIRKSPVTQVCLLTQISLKYLSGLECNTRRSGTTIIMNGSHGNICSTQKPNPCTRSQESLLHQLSHNLNYFLVY